MMTLTQKRARINSLLKNGETMLYLSSALYDNAVELMRYRNADMPAKIREYVNAAQEKSMNAHQLAFDMSFALYRVVDVIEAQPCVVEHEGGIRHIIAGNLPDYSETSTDEAEAARMFAAYEEELALTEHYKELAEEWGVEF